MRKVESCQLVETNAKLLRLVEDASQRNGLASGLQMQNYVVFGEEASEYWRAVVTALVVFPLAYKESSVSLTPIWKTPCGLLSRDGMKSWATMALTQSVVIWFGGLLLESLAIRYLGL